MWLVKSEKAVVNGSGRRVRGRESVGGCIDADQLDAVLALRSHNGIYIAVSCLECIDFVGSAQPCIVAIVVNCRV